MWRNDMPAVIITREQLAEYASRSGLAGITLSQYDDAIDRAVDEVRQAALNDYTSDSFEALTVVNAPASFVTNTMALALDMLTRADAGRADSIGDSAAEARRWLSFLSGGSTHYDQGTGAVLAKPAHNSGGVERRSTRTERVFDRDNTSQNYNYRDEEI